ncbi:MAG TPA: hypothetical protein PKE20_06150, partial [Promineifilum sp.]|nr:hypothetical protein [Promineifilum sp.]
MRCGRGWRGTADGGRPTADSRALDTDPPATPSARPSPTRNLCPSAVTTTSAAAGLPATGGLHATPPDDSHGQSSPPTGHKTAVNRDRPTTCGAGDDETCPVIRVVSHSEKVFPTPRPPQPTQNPDEPTPRPPGHSTPAGHPSPAPDGVAARPPGHSTPAGHPSPAPDEPTPRPPGHPASVGHPSPAPDGAAPRQAATPSSLASLIDRIDAMPPHLGWGSETLTAHLRKIRDTKYGIRNTGYGIRDTSARPVAAVGEREGRGAGQENSRSSPPLHSSLVTRHSSLKLYPDIALGMLREERTAAGRVWLLLRALDAPGRGMVSLDDARAALCGKESPLRLCGWRRLRQLLAEGEGVFWARERGRVDDCPLPTAHSPLPTAHCPLPTIHRLRLFGPARVAVALGVRRLVGRPVGLPLSALLGPIGDARAHLYAAFHSGRARGIPNDELRVTNEEYLNSSLVTRHSSLGMPIARDTLAALSGVCARSQAAYERRAGVAARPNI